MLVALMSFNPTITELSAVELLFSSIIAGAGMYVWRDRHTSIGRYLLLLLIGASGYTFSSGAHVFIGHPTVAHIVHNGTYAFGTLLTVAGTLMIIIFTNREGLRRRWVVGLLYGLVVVDTLVAVTDPWVGAIISELTFIEGIAITRTIEHTGAYFWVHVGVLSILALLSLSLILIKLSDANGIYRRQLVLIGTGQGFVISMFLAQLVTPNIPGFDIASIGLFGGTLTIVVAVRQWEFGQVLPIAHKTLIDNMDDPVFVLSGDDRIISVNPSASRLFGLQQSSVGGPLVEWLPSETAEAAPFVSEVPGEISFEHHHPQRVYSYQVSPATSQGVEIGRIISFRDITTQKQQETLLRDATNQARFERDGKEFVTNLLLMTSTRQTLAETACQLLVEMYEYKAASVIWAESEHEPVTVSREDVAEFEPDIFTPLATRVIESGKPATVGHHDDDTVATALRDHQLTSVQASPIKYEQLTTGALCVVSTDEQRTLPTQIIQQIATALGFKQSIGDQRAALLADYIEEITIQIDSSHFLSTVTADRAVPVDVVEIYETKGGLVYMVDAESDIDELKASLRAHEHVSTVTEVSTEPVLLAVHVQAVTVSTILADFGGVTRSIRAKAGRVILRVEFAPRTDVRAALDAVSDEWATAHMVKRLQRPTTPHTDSFIDSLTERQNDALRAATLLGFFERPQRARAQDVAEALGVSRPTALQHIRRGEEKIFEDLFSGDSRPITSTYMLDSTPSE